MPKEPENNDSPQLHTGTILWMYGAGGEDKGEVTTALFRGDHELAIDCHCDDCLYTLVLKSNNGVEFTGECRGRHNGRTWQPKGRFSLWRNEKGLLLFGTWIEDSDESYCVIELQPA